MSYDIDLCDPVSHEVLTVDAPHMICGGTYAVGGSSELSLNITYNYGDIYRQPDVFGDEGVRAIYGKTGLESIPLLTKAIDALSNDVDDNYWVATPGNAKRPLIQLLTFAKMRPDGVWSGD